MRILVFSYFYPPAYAVGGKRFTNLVRNWTEAGWRVGVVTADTAAYDRLDQSLTHAGEVFRAPVNPLPRYRGNSGVKRLLHRIWGRSLISIDRQQGWIAPAVRLAMRAAEEVRPEAIVATGPPFSAFAAGIRTAGKLRVPLVLDYRDPWTTQISSRFPPPLGPLRGRRIESLALNRAVAVVGCTERLTEQVRSGFGCTDRKFYTITNGFEDIRPWAAGGGGTEFRIVHAGSFYGNRSLAPLINGVLEMRKKGIKVRIRSIGGPVTGRDWREFRARGCEDCISDEDPLPHDMALDAMARADVLYLPSGGDVSYALPYKFFDYLSAGRPILAVCPADSAVSDYVNRTSCGGAFAPDDPAGIAGFLSEVHSGAAPEPRGLEEFLWSSLAGEYGRVVEKSCSATPSGGSR